MGIAVHPPQPPAFITARVLRMHMSWYVALMQVPPQYTTNDDIIEGRVKVTVVPEGDPRLEFDDYFHDDRGGD